MFTYNRICISDEEQERLLDYQIVIGGAGLGGLVAECALRIGFSNFHLIDGGVVEQSDLNRHNYTTDDIGEPRVKALSKRLLGINPNAKIKATYAHPDGQNVHGLLSGGDIAVDALDFSSDLPFVFDRACIESGIPVLRPCNLGWNGCVFLILSEATLLEYRIGSLSDNIELRVVDLVIDTLRPQMVLDIDYLENIRVRCSEVGAQLPLPQLATGAFRAASLCGELLYDQAQGKKPRSYSGLYHSFPRKEFSSVSY